MTPLLIPAGNPSDWTGPAGNNTWLLPGREPALVDAGVGQADHLKALAEALAGAPLSRILITHNHPDHVLGIPALLARWPSAIVVSLGDLAIAGRSEIVCDGARVSAGNDALLVVATPGHAPDHACFFDEESRDLFCGDLARVGGTIVIPASKGGNLSAYLDSLRHVRAMAPRRLLPGHGIIIDDPVSLIDEYLAHRLERESQIVSAIRAGARTPEEIVDRVYVGLPPALRGAAIDSVTAHLDKLRDDGGA